MFESQWQTVIPGSDFKGASLQLLRQNLKFAGKKSLQIRCYISSESLMGVFGRAAEATCVNILGV